MTWESTVYYIHNRRKNVQAFQTATVCIYYVPTLPSGRSIGTWAGSSMSITIRNGYSLQFILSIPRDQCYQWHLQYTWIKMKSLSSRNRMRYTWRWNHGKPLEQPWFRKMEEWMINNEIRIYILKSFQDTRFSTWIPSNHRYCKKYSETHNGRSGTFPTYKMRTDRNL